MSADAMWFAATIVLEAVLASALVAWVASRHRTPGQARLGPRPRWRGLLVRRLLGRGLPLAGAALAGTAQQRGDLLLLAAFGAGGVVLGAYALAQRLADAALLLPAVVADVMLPAAARATAAPGSGLAATPRDDAALQRLFDTVLAGAWVAMLLLLVLAPLLPQAFGPDYAAAVLPLQLLALALPLTALDLARRRWCVLRAEQALALRVALVGLGAMALAASLLVPAWGAPGAALAVLLSTGLQALLAPRLAATASPLARLQWRALWPFGRLLAGPWRVRLHPTGRAR